MEIVEVLNVRSTIRAFKSESVGKETTLRMNGWILKKISLSCRMRLGQ